MWCDELPLDKRWISLISDYVSCGCGGIRTLLAKCPACGSDPYDLTPVEFEDLHGERHRVPRAFAGAEGRYEDWELLALMEREWKRPRPTDATTANLDGKMSYRATLVILYWTYFESRMNRLISIGLRSLPIRVQKDLSARYSGVGYHMRELYGILFGVKYRDDLLAIGADSIDGHLARVQKARNEFVHGFPSALSDGLVEAVVRYMKDEHEAWIGVYNRRIAAAF